MEEQELTEKVIGCAMKVHSVLAWTFHSLVGRSCCFALIQGGAAAPPYHSKCGNFRQRYEISCKSCTSCQNVFVVKGTA